MAGKKRVIRREIFIALLTEDSIPEMIVWRGVFRMATWTFLAC
jgi:hypothetical protein